jgi:hypothetical protein
LKRQNQKQTSDSRVVRLITTKEFQEAKAAIVTKASDSQAACFFFILKRRFERQNKLHMIDEAKIDNEVDEYGN